MSARGQIVRSVLDKAVKFNIPVLSSVELINDIFDSLDWDSDNHYTNKDVIEYAEFIINDKYSSVDKESYINWVDQQRKELQND